MSSTPASAPAPAAESGPWARRIAALLAWLDRHPWLLPLLSFSAGWIGYWLVQRGPELARGIAIAALLLWPWMLLENLFGRWLQKLSRGLLPPTLAPFVTQTVQQELLFFVLPFVIGAWSSNWGQGGFAVLVAAVALFSTLDPLYHRWVGRSAAGSIAFQAFCTFVTALVVLPVALHLPVEQAVPWSVAIALLAMLAGLPRLVQTGEWKRWRSLALIAAMAAWLGSALPLRPWIPPLGLHLTESRITQSIDGLSPGPEVRRIPARELDRGVIAYVAVHAPSGLSQDLRFDWHHRGQSVESIRASIEGTGGRGWRTYTRKQRFPEGACGDWRVDLRTPADQLVGRLYFKVVDC